MPQRIEPRAAPAAAGAFAAITRAVDRLDQTARARPRFALLVAGAVATLALPPVFLWPVLFVSLFVLVRALDHALTGEPVAIAAAFPSSRWSRLRHSPIARAAAIGWLFGFGYFVVSLYWISASLFAEPRFLWLLPFSATLIPAGLAVFWGVATAVAATVWQPGLRRILALAAALAAAEWLRGHLFTGLPWNTLGYALTAPPLLMQSASLVGVYGLTLVTVVLLAAPAAAFDEDATPSRIRASLGLPVVGLAALSLYGGWRLSLPEPAPVAGVRLRLLQPNIPQETKWRGENREAIFRRYLEMSARDAAGVEDGLAGASGPTTHLIWPESAIPFLLLSSPGALEAIAGLLPETATLITGAIRIEEGAPSAGVTHGRRVYNSMLALDDRARLIAHYDKRHLVPFGEYLPFQRVLEAIGLEQMTRIQGGFSVGAEPRRYWQVPGLPPASPLVCYESIFPDEVVTPGARPAFFLNVTNDGWFGITAGPHQHFHQSRLRAVEQGLPLVRVANTGISAVVDGRGRVLQRLPLGREGVIDAGLPGALPPTWYARAGESTWALLLLACCAIVVDGRRRVRGRARTSGVAP